MSDSELSLRGELLKNSENKETELVTSFVSSLESLNDFLLANDLFENQTFETYFLNVSNLKADVDEVLSAVRFVKTQDKLIKQMEHDLKNITQRVFASFTILNKFISNNIFGITTEDKAMFFDVLFLLRENWYRFYVAFKDILLKALSESIVPIENQGSLLDINVLKKVFYFFSSSELPGLLKEAEIYKRAGQFSSYQGIQDRKVNMDVDWDVLSEHLVGKKIKGDTAVVTNFVLNALRNSLKKRIEVEGEHTELRLQIFVENDELVIKVEDTGKGMEDKHLNPDSKDFIFLSGNSWTGSTGLGLSYINTRLASMGVELRVFSRRVAESSADDKPFVYYSNGGGKKDFHMSFYHGEDAEGLVSSNISKHGTLFEIYLPLE